MKHFEKITKQQTNELTDLILMVGVLSKKLTNIADLISVSNILLKENLLCNKKQKESNGQDYKLKGLLSKEDYID